MAQWSSANGRNNERLNFFPHFYLQKGRKFVRMKRLKGEREKGLAQKDAERARVKC